MLERTAVASASIRFSTNLPPSEGTCEVVTAGVAFTESFTVACMGWTDDEGDALQYRYWLNPHTVQPVRVYHFADTCEPPAT